MIEDTETTRAVDPPASSFRISGDTISEDETPIEESPVEEPVSDDTLYEKSIQKAVDDAEYETDIETGVDVQERFILGDAI